MLDGYAHIMDPRQEISRLIEVEFLSRFEMAARFGAILLGGGLLLWYWDWTFVWLWFGGYFAAMALYWWFLKTRGPNPTRGDVTNASLLFVLLTCSFIWLPVRAMMEPIVPIAFSGAAAYFCFVIFMIWRSETSLLLIGGVVKVILAAHLVLLAHYVPQTEVFSQRLIMAVAALASVGYLTQAMLIQRQRQLTLRASTRRSMQAQKREAVGQLAAGIAHQFNNALTAIQGNLELAAITRAEDERSEVLSEAHRAAVHAATLVRQLLAYSHSATLTAEAVSLNDVLDVAESNARAMLPDSVMFVVARPSPDLFPITDRDRLVAVLGHLISNARDAMPQGGTLTLRAARVAEPAHHVASDGTLLSSGPYAAIEVADTGKGIPEDLLGRVTDPFFTTKPVGMGSGMGLAEAAGFARQSGGGLTIASAPGATCVTLLLPLSDNAGFRGLLRLRTPS